MDFNWTNYFKNNFFIVIICLLIGIASHIFWDSFTHPYGDFVKMIPWLRESSNVFGFHIPNNRVLHIISTIVGGVVVFYAILRIPKATDYAKSRNPLYYWFIVVGAGVIVANIRILTGMHYSEYYNVATSFVSGLIAGTMLAPLFLERVPLKG